MDDDIQRWIDAQRYSEAFTLLSERFKEKVFRLAFSMLRNEAQAEDTAQDVFLKIWKGLPGYHQAASLSTWIYAITRNTCLTELRKRATLRTVSLDEQELAMGAEGGCLLQCSDAAPGAGLDVESLLAELPEKYRRLIILFHLEQKSYEDVAAMLGIPLGTVKTLLFRAKKELLRIGARRAHPGPPAARLAAARTATTSIEV